METYGFCGICDEQYSGGSVRIAGMDVCPRCEIGNVLRILQTRGYALDIKIWQTENSNPRSGGPNVWYHIRLLGRTPVQTDLHVRFSRENILDKVAKIFTREIQVGDPLFDDMIYVRSKESSPVRGFLASEGVQSAVMEMVGSRGSLTIEGDLVRLKATEETALDEQRFTLHAAALLKYMAANASRT